MLVPWRLFQADRAGRHCVEPAPSIELRLHLHGGQAKHVPLFVAAALGGIGCEPQLPRHRMMKNTSLVLSACCLAMLSVGDNSTAVMAALPAMTRDLQLDSAAVEWVVNAYLLAAAVFILLGGEAADRVGARRSSTAGIALFALASLIIALAPSGIIVIGARALQGLGAAFAAAGTLAAATESPESERAGAIAAWTGFLMLGFSIGPLVGGAVTHYAGWRFNFWLNVLAIVPAAIMLAMRPGPPGRKADTLDWLGVWLLAVFMVSLILGLRSLPSIRSLPQATIVPAAVAIFAFAALILGGATASAAAARLQLACQGEPDRRLRNGVRPHVRHHDFASLLQSVRTGA
jgi:MFS family permease